LYWVEAIRAFAITAVVVLHVAAPLIYEFGRAPISDWWAANLYDSATRMCVPLFLMLTGFLSLGRDAPPARFLAGRLRKVFIPMLAWSFFYLFFRVYYLGHGAIDAKTVSKLLVAPSSYHLWYFYALLPLYLFVPILRKVVASGDVRIRWYFVGLWFTAVAVIPAATGRIAAYNSLDFNMISGYVGYLMLGYLLGHWGDSRKRFGVACLVLLAAVAVTAVGNHAEIVANGGKFGGYFYGFLSPNVIVMSAASFVVLKFLATRFGPATPVVVRSCVRELAGASFGIYLVHVLFLRLFELGDFGFVLSANTGTAVYAIPVTALAALITSYATVRLLRAIPVLRYSVS
jgi:surface polysaccharide O-acyltransferase-like enzyme